MILPFLSVRQPWAWAIIHGGKDIENRSWWSDYRGPLGIQAARTIDREGIALVEKLAGVSPLPAAALLTGHAVGMVNMTNCVERHRSKWKVPECIGFVLADPRAFTEFMPITGRLSMFKVEVPQRMLDALVPGTRFNAVALPDPSQQGRLFAGSR